MPVKKKKFIDKKNAVTFHLVHRSQKDPLQADEDAPQRVLVPAVDASDKNPTDLRKEEQRKYGVNFDDEYDYLQHLKDVEELQDVRPGVDVYHVPAKSNTKAPIQLSSQVFGSEVETGVGLLNKAVPIVGPQLDWDPDIVAGLDDDFNFDDPENIMLDDFVIQANAETSDHQVYEGLSSNDNYTLTNSKSSETDTERDRFQSLTEWTDHHELKEYSSDNECDNGSDIGSLDGSFETKSHFTNYSMTSSVIRRNDGLTLLDDRFEKLYMAYDDSEVGALDQEEISGYVGQNSQILTSVLEEFEANQEKATLEEVRQASEVNINGRGEAMVQMDMEAPKEKWDCESILSTYSNIYNHPKQITEPNSGKPRSQRQSCCSEIQSEPVKEIPKASTIRSTDETTEQRRLRKQAVKEERKLRREEKIKNKNAFKREEIRQKKEQINLQHNLQSIKLG